MFYLGFLFPGRKSARERYSHVQSSGYGKRSPDVSPRKSQSYSPRVSPTRPGQGRQNHMSSDYPQHHRKSKML